MNISVGVPMVKTRDSKFKSPWVANQKIIIFFIYLFIKFLECGLMKKEKYNIKEINMTWLNFMWFEYRFSKIKK